MVVLTIVHDRSKFTKKLSLIVFIFYSYAEFQSYKRNNFRKYLRFFKIKYKNSIVIIFNEVIFKWNYINKSI